MISVKLPSENSTCQNKCILQIERSNYILYIHFYSLFDVLGSYLAVLIDGAKKNEKLISIYNSNFYNAIEQTMHEIEKFKAYTAKDKEILDGIISELYEFMIRHEPEKDFLSGQ